MVVKVVGVTFKNEDGTSRQDNMQKASEQELKIVELKREPDNKYDPNAIAVHINGGQIGYIGKEIAVDLAQELDAGVPYQCTVSEIDIYKNKWYCKLMVNEA